MTDSEIRKALLMIDSTFYTKGKMDKAAAAAYTMLIEDYEFNTVREAVKRLARQDRMPIPRELAAICERIQPLQVEDSEQEPVENSDYFTRLKKYKADCTAYYHSFGIQTFFEQFPEGGQENYKTWLSEAEKIGADNPPDYRAYLREAV